MHRFRLSWSKIVGQEGSFRTRLVVLISVLVLAVTGTVSSYFVLQHRRDLESALESKVVVMQKNIRQKGAALARNIALSSERAIAVMDFLFLTEVLDSAVKNDPEILYGIIMDKNRRALVHTDITQAGQILDDAQASVAAAATAVSTFEFAGDPPVLEVVVPITVADASWGTIRLGMSLGTLNTEIAANEASLAAKLRSSIVTIAIAALLLSLLGSVLGAVIANRLVSPLRLLADATTRMAGGELDQSVEAKGSEEFVSLARSFNAMTTALRSRDAALRRNMTDLAHALERAEEAARLKNEFLANISHELRTPLNAIINVPVTLLREYDTVAAWACGACGARFQSDDDNDYSDNNCPECGATSLTHSEEIVAQGDPKEHKHFLGRLLQQARHLLHIVNDLLDFSKLEANKMTLGLESFELQAVLSDLSETVSGLAEEKKLTLHIEAEEPTLEIHADRLKIAQILINLVSNAIKFTDEGGEISVLVGATSEGLLHFDVKDTGIGIPKDKQEVVFESFRQVDGGHTRSHGGTGLGLAITKQLIELHGGQIWLESEVNVGTTFSFEIPIDARQPAPKTTPNRPQLPRVAQDADDVRVFVVDDNQLHLEMARKLLSTRGFESILLQKSSDALERIRTERPQVVVLDVIMPGVNGLELLEQLKQDPETRDIPVVMVSGELRHRERVEELGGLWVAKPWDANTLVDLIHRSTIPREDQDGTQEVRS